MNNSARGIERLTPETKAFDHIFSLHNQIEDKGSVEQAFLILGIIDSHDLNPYHNHRTLNNIQIKRYQKKFLKFLRKNHKFSKTIKMAT